MNGAVKKRLRCAIYTRKSTEHNLDLEFNSLDAQREACEAYIKSQSHEGWRLVDDRYDDGAFSGASLDRPALQRLLVQVRAQQIDVIVVYKVDRLTRSLADFAKLVELFDQHSVSFVSVTQHFNTTSSMGRLTLNVLLSFAQFEREVIGERVRDKIAASKRKGLWVGGPVPLGYASVNKKLTVIPEEADTVRLIFERYLELGSIGPLIEDLDRRGIRTKRRFSSTGRPLGGIRFGVGPLAHLLRNRFYIGEVVYRDGVYAGEHDAIVDRDLFDAVQAKLAAGAVARRVRLRGTRALLAGRIFDDHGSRMTPTHANKNGVRYRYYVSHALLQKQPSRAGSVPRVPAPEIEALIVNTLRDRLGDAATEPVSDRELVERHVDRIVVKPDAIELLLLVDGDQFDREDLTDDGAPKSPPVLLSLPWARRDFVAVKGVLYAPSLTPTMAVETSEALLAAIAKARSWVADLVAGRVVDFAQIAQHEGKVERHVRFLAPLAFVSPRIVASIIDRSASADLTVTALARALPFSWNEQENRVESLNSGRAPRRLEAQRLHRRPVRPDGQQ